jgi:hypothetical protein
MGFAKVSPAVVRRLHLQASAVTVHFYGLVHWEDPMEEALGPVPCQCSPAEGTITKEGMLHYKASTSYLGKEHWKACFVVLRWEPQQLWAQACVKSLAGGKGSWAGVSLCHCAVGSPRDRELLYRASSLGPGFPGQCSP